MNSLFLLASSLVLLLSGPAFAKTENVFDRDDRLPAISITAPSKWVGKLWIGSNWCSATLVYRDIALTAAHCLVDTTTKKLKTGPMAFYYGVVDNNHLDFSPVTPVDWGTLDPEAERTADWAFVRLEKPLGALYGWMGLRMMDLQPLFGKGGIQLTSYSGDFLGGRTAGIESNCSFMGASVGYLLHNCDMTKGASGAPLYRAEWDEASRRVVYYVLALNVADRRDGKPNSLVGIPYTNLRGNVAVPTSRFIASLQRIIAAEGAAAR